MVLNLFHLSVSRISPTNASLAMSLTIDFMFNQHKGVDIKDNFCFCSTHFMTIFGIVNPVTIINIFRSVLSQIDINVSGRSTLGPFLQSIICFVKIY